MRGRKCLFHGKSFIALLFAIGHIDAWGAMAPLVPGQITVGGAHETFSKDNWEYKTFWILLRGIDTEMLESPCTVHPCKFADTFSANSYFNLNFGMKFCDWAWEM